MSIFTKKTPAETVKRIAKNMPRPPKRGVGTLWTFLGEGMSITLNFLAILPEMGVRITAKIKLEKKPRK